MIAPKVIPINGACEHGSSGSMKGKPSPDPNDPNMEFVSLFLTEQRELHRYIVTLLAGHQDADDLLQETAGVLWRKFDEFQRGTSFYAWACKTAYLLILEYRRRKGREALAIDRDVLNTLATTVVEDDATDEIRITALEHCLAKLTPHDRQLIDRFYTEKVKVKEIAREMQRPEKSIYRTLGRIRLALSQCMRRWLASADGREGGQ
jgi:RNA polymerase sigma-70 factor (ECF subfamily)